MAEKQITAHELRDGMVILAFGREHPVRNVVTEGSHIYYTDETLGIRDRLDRFAPVVILVPVGMPIILTPEDYQRMQTYLGEIIDRARRLRHITSDAGSTKPIDVSDASDAWDHVSVLGGNLADINHTFFGHNGPLS